jgi:hypothetical protein
MGKMTFLDGRVSSDVNCEGWLGLGPGLIVGRKVKAFPLSSPTRDDGRWWSV